MLSTATPTLWLFLLMIASHAVIAKEPEKSEVPGGTAQVINDANYQRGDPLCGPRSLWVAAARVGVSLDVDSLVADSETSLVYGTTILGLKRAAEKHGLTAEGYKLNWQQLKILNSPAILFVNGDHFFTVDPRQKQLPPTDIKHKVLTGHLPVPVKPTNEESVAAYDRPYPARFITEADLTPIWNGIALVIEKPKIKKLYSGPKLAFDENLFDWGVIKVEEKVKHIYRFRNEGDKQLLISKVATSCGCTAGQIINASIAPGADGFIEVSFNSTGKQGAIINQIYVFSNDPHPEPITLFLQGQVDVGAFTITPASLDLGSVAWGTTRSQTAYLRSSNPEEKIEGIDIEVDRRDRNGNNIAADAPFRNQFSVTWKKWEMTDWYSQARELSANDQKHHPKNSSLLGFSTLSTSGFSNITQLSGIYAITLIFSPSFEKSESTIYGRMSIHTNQSTDKITPIEFVARTSPPIKAIPNSLLFLVEQMPVTRHEEHWKNVCLIESSGKPLEILSIDTGGLPLEARKSMINKNNNQSGAVFGVNINVNTINGFSSTINGRLTVKLKTESPKDAQDEMTVEIPCIVKP